MVLVMDVKDGSALSILNVRPWLGQNVACEVLSQEGQLWRCQENVCQRGDDYPLFIFQLLQQMCG